MVIRFKIIILTLALLHFPYLEARVSVDASPMLQNLLSIHKNILNEDVQKNGQKLIDQTARFIRDSKNKKLMTTPDGAELLRHQVMLGNYLAVKDHLEKCVKNKQAARQLNTRVLDASLQSMKKTNNFSMPCSAINTGNTDFVTLNNQVMKAMKKAITPEVKNILSNTILVNSARALLSFKYKFDPKFSANKSDIEKISNEYPVKNRAEIKRELNNYTQRVKGLEKKINLQEMQESLNRSIYLLKSNTSPERLIEEVQKPAGVLLLTSTMKGRTKPINAKDLEKVLKESLDQIRDEKSDTLEEITVEGLVKINPFATGEMLLIHPEYSGVICDAINKINISDITKAKRDRYVTIGTAILGGALVLTGVGAMAGAYVLTGSLTVGLAAGTVAGAVTTATTVASVALGLGSALYHGTNAYEAHKEMLQLENSFLTNNGDAQNITEARAALENFKENRTSAMLALAGVGLSVVNFPNLFSMLKLGSKTFKLPELVANSKILAAISETNVARKIKDAMTTAGQFSSVKIDSFFTKLAESSESVRIKILELMKNSKFTSKELKEMVEDALYAARKCTN